MTDGIKVNIVDRGRGNLYLRYVDPITGKRVERSSGTKSRKDAAKAAGKWEAELREGRYKPANKITWEEFQDRYESEVLASLAAGTVAKACGAFNAVTATINPRRLADLTASRMSEFQQKLRDDDLTEASIAAHLRHLKAAFNWARSVGLMHTVPSIKMPERARVEKMKGRPITGEEFDRMLAAVPAAILAHERRETKEDQWKEHERELIASWRFLLRGLWYSGLRLGEALDLWWNRDDRLSVEMDGKRPMLRIAAEAEKGNKDRLLPLAPAAAELLRTVPEADRVARVFNPIPRRSRNPQPRMKAVSRTITAIGKAAKVKASDGAKTKWASAHDLRRSFGERWSSKVMPAILQQLMRHESISTTMRFYVGRDAEKTAELLYGLEGDTLGDTSQKTETTRVEDSTQAVTKKQVIERRRPDSNRG